MKKSAGVWAKTSTDSGPKGKAGQHQPCSITKIILETKFKLPQVNINSLVYIIQYLDFEQSIQDNEKTKYYKQ